MKRNYIKALTDLIHTGTKLDEIISGFVKVLQHRGHERLFKPVLQGVMVSLAKSEKANSPMVTVASKKSKVSEEAISYVLKELGSTDMKYELTEDASCIGGFKVTYKYKSLDKSYKRALVSLYEAVQAE